MSQNNKQQDDEDLFKSLFSFHGYIGRLGFFGASLFLGSFLSFVLKFNNELLSILGCLLVFYSGTAVYQKRCRDIGSKGTFVILFYAAFIIIRSCLEYMMIHNLPAGGIWKIILLLTLIVYIVVAAFLLIVPGKKDKNPDLISPLLKNPYAYTAIWFVIFLISHYVLRLYYY